MAGSRTFDEVYDEVTAEVARAARLIDSGLWAFEVMVQGRGTREQVKAAAEAAQNAGRQVATALRQARDLWRRVQMEHHNSHAMLPPLSPPAHHGQARQAQHGQRAPLQREVEEQIAAQHDLKRQYRDALREQQRALRETLRTQQQAARSQQQAARSQQQAARNQQQAARRQDRRGL